MTPARSSSLSFLPDPSGDGGVAAATKELKSCSPWMLESMETKQMMKASFSRWYADEVRVAMDEGKSVSDMKVDLRASVIKPLPANLVI